MRVLLQELSSFGGYNAVWEMDGVPRPGDYIEVDSKTHTVREVIWTPQGAEAEVTVKFR